MSNVDANDAVQFAAQLGRLDFIAALLAILAILLGLAAVPFFLYLRWQAKEIATKAANEALNEASDRMERVAVERMEALLPNLIEEYRQLAQNAVTAEMGDEIAAAQDDGAGER